MVKPESAKSIGTVLPSPVVTSISSFPPFFKVEMRLLLTSAWATHITRWLFGAAGRQTTYLAVVCFLPSTLIGMPGGKLVEESRREHEADGGWLACLIELGIGLRRGVAHVRDGAEVMLGLTAC